MLAFYSEYCAIEVFRVLSWSCSFWFLAAKSAEVAGRVYRAAAISVVYYISLPCYSLLCVILLTSATYCCCNSAKSFCDCYNWSLAVYIVDLQFARSYTIVGFCVYRVFVCEVIYYIYSLVVI